MKFTMFCAISKKGKQYEAITSTTIYHNVLLSCDVELDVTDEHEFMLVVNKKGSLTLLCIK